MERQWLCTLRSKIQCIFKTEVIHGVEDKSELKRPDQNYCVIASENLRDDFELAFKEDRCMPTEKFDGTSTIVKKYKNKAWLWVRRDRKLTKIAEQKKKTQGELVFDINDFREAPETWTPSESCINQSGNLIPDITGNIMGWLPLDSNHLYLWHAQTVDADNDRILVLNVTKDRGDLKFKLNLDLLSDHLGQSFELIGTNVNGNPYKLGTKKCPINFLIRHGCIPVDNLPVGDLTRGVISDWFACSDGENNVSDANIEGIVWHCKDGEMFKVTRQHLKLKWPADIETKLATRPIHINLYDDKATSNNFIKKLLKLNGRSFNAMSAFSSHFVKLFTP